MAGYYISIRRIFIIIGIKHDFPFINIRKVPREVLKTEGEVAARGVYKYNSVAGL